MKTVSVKKIINIIEKLVMETALYLRPDIEAFYQSAIQKESSESAQEVLQKFLCRF